MMDRAARMIINLTLFLQVLLLYLLFFESRVELPVALQVAGRLHPVVLHVPIGVLVFTLVVFLFQSQFKKKQFQRLVLLCLLIAALSASLTALFGFFLSLSGDYGAEQVLLHKRSGVALSLLTFILLVWFTFQPRNKSMIQGFSLLLFLVLIVAGHSGATLTHGENYVLGPAGESDEINPEASFYEAALVPVLERKCFSCHNESKAKGKLIMTSVDNFKRGGENGMPWVAGQPDSSRLIQYLHLPLEHEHHMPPEGKPQLSSTEVALLEAWIKAGADFEKQWNAFAPTDSLRRLAEVSRKAKASAEETYPFKAVPPETVAKLNTPFRSVFPLYQGSPALQTDFFVAQAFERNSLTELKAIDEQLVILNLSNMPLTEEDAKTITQFKNLEQLNLNATGLTDAGLQHLSTLKKLESLAVSGNPITQSALTALLRKLPLQKVFIWNTSITEPQYKELVAEFPDTEFTHTLFNDTEVLELSKPLLENEGVVKKGDRLKLKHTMPGVIIRYTLDGSKPDSVRSERYTGPVEVTETVLLKAIACREGWYCSPVLETTVFVAGKKPRQATLLTPPDKKYPGEGARSLTDERKGFTDILTEPAWLGYRHNPFEATFEFDPTITLHKVVLSYADNNGSYLMPPEKVEVWSGSSEGNIRLIKTDKVEQPTTYRAQGLRFVTIELPQGHYPFLKVVARPVAKLPAWHSGKGEKGWFFIDEVFFY